MSQLSRPSARAIPAATPAVTPAASDRRSAPSGPRATSTTRAPMLVYWETTLACGLACRHCRATAMPDRDPPS